MIQHKLSKKDNSVKQNFKVPNYISHTVHIIFRLHVDYITRSKTSIIPAYLKLNLQEIPGHPRIKESSRNTWTSNNQIFKKYLDIQELKNLQEIVGHSQIKSSRNT